MSFHGRSVAAATIILLSVVSAQSQAQVGSAELPGAIIVQVTDTSLNPLPAAVMIRELDFEVQLSVDGRALLVSVRDGVYRLEVRHEGHAADSRLVRIAGDTARIEFALAPVPREPAGPWSAVHGDIGRARLHSFLEQSGAMTSASFLTRAAIERSGARTVSELLRGVRAVRVERGVGGRPILRSTEASGPSCASGMLVLVDGTPVASDDASRSDAVADRRAAAERGQAPWRLASANAVNNGVPALKWVGPSGGDLVRVASHHATASGAAAGRAHRLTDVDRIRVSSIVAIEVYPSPSSAPSELEMFGSGCGVVLMWTVSA